MKDDDKSKRDRELGIERSAGSAPAYWASYAQDFIRSYARDHETVHVDDLWDAGLVQPPNPQALGQVMRACQALGWIEQMRSGRFYLCLPSVNSNKNMKVVWKSLIYGE